MPQDEYALLRYLLASTLILQKNGAVEELEATEKLGVEFNALSELVAFPGELCEMVAYRFSNQYLREPK